MTKGIISHIDGEKIAVILPEYGGVVTKPLMVYGGTKAVADYSINEFVVVCIFNENYFNDAVVMGK